MDREFIKRYALNPEKYPTVESLEDLANEVKGIRKVKIDLDQLSPEARAEVERRLKDAKAEAREKLGVSQDSLNLSSTLNEGIAQDTTNKTVALKVNMKPTTYYKGRKIWKYSFMFFFIFRLVDVGIQQKRIIVVSLIA